jgi:hypothetical protein
MRAVLVEPGSAGTARLGTPARSAARGRLAAWVVPALALTAVFALVRVEVARSPGLAETYYDEALTGLMALRILRGEPQVFYWGQPYLGALDAYLAAGAFHLFGPSTLALRLGTAWISVLGVWATWRLTRRIAGEGWGVLAGLGLALPPIFLTYLQLSSHAEGVALALGTVALAAAMRLVDVGDDAPPLARAVTWAALGVSGGLAWWMSQMTVMLLGAASLGLLAARPDHLRRPGPYAAGALALMASLPFWVWNARHEWATFHHLLTWGEPLPGAAARVRNVADTVLRSVRGWYWDGRAVSVSPAGLALGWVVVAAVYVPAVALAGERLIAWARRLARRERPWQGPLDLVALAFWLTVAAHLLTWFGTSGVLRYAVTFHTVLPALAAAALARVARAARATRVAALALGAALLGFNLLTHVEFLRADARATGRPAAAALARLEGLGVRACYADSRIAQVLTFESRERIVCADYHGLRDYAPLRAVDGVEDPDALAIVTHRVLKAPAPADMALALQRIGARAERATVGDYVIFHHFRPPAGPLRPVPPDGWRAHASTDEPSAALAFDRKVWTRWRAPKRAGEWLLVDLGHAVVVAQVSLLAAPSIADAPVALRVETSLDGRSWDAVRSEAPLLAGLHWWRGHPRLDDSGRVVVRLPPRPARFLRLTSAGAEFPGGFWTVGELFVYEPAESPWTPPAGAASALAEAARELEHWMDDPHGPHPRRAPVTWWHRRGQVRWARVFSAADQALAAAPEWEEAHHLYGTARERAGWAESLDWDVDLARADGAWEEVVRWATLANARPGIAWRAGRQAALAEALERLGRPADARAVRARPAPRPTRPLDARFGRALVLEGIDLPEAVRPGQPLTLRYHWRLLAAGGPDYWAFLHAPALTGGVNPDRIVGQAEYGLSRWPVGDRLCQEVTFTVPARTPPGAHPVHMGVWLPSTGKRLSVAAADAPARRRLIELGTVTVLPEPLPAGGPES